MGIVHPESHSKVESTSPRDNQAHTSNPVESIHSIQERLWFWFGEWLVSTRLTESVCRWTMFSIPVELISTSHGHVGQSRPHGSKNTPNHEGKHLEASRIKFSPFKLNNDRFGKSSFMNPQSWMFRVRQEEGGFRLKVCFTSNSRVVCKDGWIMVHHRLVCPVSIHLSSTWM